MKINESNIEIFDRFLHNELSDEEKLVFEKTLAENPEFKKEFEEFNLLVEGIKMKGLEDLKGILKSKGEVKYWGNLWGPKWTIASAAILAIFTVMFFVLEHYVSRKSTLENQIAIEESVPTEEHIQYFDENIDSLETSSEQKTKEILMGKDLEEQMVVSEEVYGKAKKESADELIHEVQTNNTPNSIENTSKATSTAPIMNKEDMSQVRANESTSERLISSEKLLDSFYKVQILPNGFLKMDAKLLDTFLFNNQDWADVRIAFWTSPLNTIAYSNKSGYKNIKLSKIDIYGWEPQLLTDILIEGFGGDIFVKYNQKVYLLKNGAQNMPIEQIKDKTKLAKLEILWN